MRSILFIIAFTLSTALGAVPNLCIDKAAGGWGDGGPATNAVISTSGAVPLPGGAWMVHENNRGLLRKIAPDGNISTIAGNGYPSGPVGTTATEWGFSNLRRAAVNAAGDIYFGASTGTLIYKVNAADQSVTKAAGTGTAAFSGDGGQAYDAELGGTGSLGGMVCGPLGDLYLADGNRVRKVDAATGVISTVIGDGVADYAGDGGAPASARVFMPTGLWFMADGSMLIADSGNHRIRKVDAAFTSVTIAGSGALGLGDLGPATDAAIGNPRGITADALGNLYFYEDAGWVRKVALDGTISTIAGTGIRGYSGDGGPATAAQVGYAYQIFVTADGRLMLPSFDENRVRAIGPDLNSGLISTVVGTGALSFAGDGGPASIASLNDPRHAVRGPDGSMYIAEYQNFRVRKVDAVSGVISTVAGNGICASLGDGGPALAASLLSPTALAFNAAGDLFIAERGSHGVRKVAAATGIISTYAGTGTAGAAGDGGPAASAQLNLPTSLAVFGDELYISDYGNDRIRKVTGAGSGITTVAGNGVGAFAGDGSDAMSASINGPTQIALDSSGNLFISDTINKRIRKVTASTGKISTVAGDGSATAIADGASALAVGIQATGLAVEDDGDLYISAARIYWIDHATGIVHLLTANKTSNNGDRGAASAAGLTNPQQITLDGTGHLLVPTSYGDRVRVLLACGDLPTLTPTLSTTFTGSPTITQTGTPSGTPTLSPTQTGTITSSSTPTGTQTSTPSATVTDTPTATPTATLTATGTVTPTTTRTATGTGTATATLTATGTPTASATLTLTPSASATATGTSTPAYSPTDSPTPGTPEPERAAAGECFVYPSPVRGGKAAVACRFKEAGRFDCGSMAWMAALAWSQQGARAVGAQVLDLDVSGYPPGVYACLLRLEYEGGAVEALPLQKFVVLR